MHGQTARQCVTLLHDSGDGENAGCETVPSRLVRFQRELGSFLSRWHLAGRMHLPMNMEVVASQVLS